MVRDGLNQVDWFVPRNQQSSILHVTIRQLHIERVNSVLAYIPSKFLQNLGQDTRVLVEVGDSDF